MADLNDDGRYSGGLTEATGLVLLDVIAERRRQDEQHIDDSAYLLALQPAATEPSPMTVLMEEVGEVNKAINDGEGLGAVREELIQVISVATAWVEAIDKVAAANPRAGKLQTE